METMKLHTKFPGIKYSFLNYVAFTVKNYVCFGNATKVRMLSLQEPRKRSNVTRPFSLLEGGVWGQDYPVGGYQSQNMTWQYKRVRKIYYHDNIVRSY